MKERNNLQGVHSTQRDNKERDLNKSYPCSVILMYIWQVPELHFFWKSVSTYIIFKIS